MKLNIIITQKIIIFALQKKEDSYKYLIWRIIFTILAILSLSTYAYYLFNYILQLEQKDITYKYILSFCFIALVINIFLFIIGLIKGLKQWKQIGKK